MKKTKLLVLLPLFALLAACGGSDEPGPGPGPSPTPHEHTWASVWSSDATDHWHSCTDTSCVEVSDKANHTFEWVVTREASFESKGLESHKCTVCGFVDETRDIPKLEHAYADDWSNDSEQHWHACLDEGYEDKNFGADLNDHLFDDGDPEVAPDYGVAGHTASGYCPVCGYEAEALEIPALNETDYTRKVTRDGTNSRSLHEKWTLKDPASIGKDQYIITKDYVNGGYVTVTDASGVATHYTPYNFNSTFDGVELSYDASSKTTTLTVADTGFTFEDMTLTFPANAKGTVVITGGPLTISAPENSNCDGLSFWGSSTVGSMLTGVIDTDVIITCPGDGSSKFGLNESILKINEGASLTIDGFDNGICACYTDITVNGLLDVTGSVLSIASSNTSKTRTIKVADGLEYYFDGAVQEGNSTNTDLIRSGSVKHFEVKAIA